MNQLDIITENLKTFENFKVVKYIGFKGRGYKFEINGFPATAQLEEDEKHIYLEFEDGTKRKIRVRELLDADEIQIGMTVKIEETEQVVEVSSEKDVQKIKINIQDNKLKVSAVSGEKKKKEEIVVKEEPKKIVKEEPKKVVKEEPKKPKKEETKKPSQMKKEEITEEIIAQSLKVCSKIKQKKTVVIYDFKTKEFRLKPFNTEFSKVNKGIKRMQIDRIKASLSQSEVIVNLNDIFAD